MRKPSATEGSGAENGTAAATQAPLVVSINVDNCGLVMVYVFPMLCPVIPGAAAPWKMLETWVLHIPLTSCRICAYFRQLRGG